MSTSILTRKGKLPIDTYYSTNTSGSSSGSRTGSSSRSNSEQPPPPEQQQKPPSQWKQNKGAKFDVTSQHQLRRRNSLSVGLRYRRQPK